MASLAPHLLLRADSRASEVSTMLQAAGYMVSKISDDDIIASIAGAPHVDGVVVELPALASIAAVRQIQGRYGHDVVTLVISKSAATVRRALPSTRVMNASDVSEDLISTIDLALAAQEMRYAG